MTWHKIELTYDQILSTESKIRQQFMEIWRLHGAPEDAALFFYTKDASVGKALFLSPKASEIASTLIPLYSGVKCEQPPKYFDQNNPNSRVGLVVGVSGADSMLKSN